ncbi:hypothetical protein N0V95_006016 [Ascochyta clinopodiicola]|nr:hypothetical protein N0V95_006016 [Ascochyta clinopodiicola]
MTRVEELWTFSVTLRRVLDDYGPAGSHLDDLPFNGTFKYFGFTAGYADRQKAHDRRRSSWLMALFDAVCRTLLRNPNGVPLFSFKHFVIAYPTSRIECQLGEELFCRIGSSYYYTGLGFNIQHAGVSVHSSSLGELLHLEADDMWNACELARYDNPISDLQTQRDFDMFFEKYTQKCEEASDQTDAEYAALVEKGIKLQSELDELRKELLPYSVFETKYKALQDLWKKVEDGYAPEDSENRDRIRSMSEAALAEFQAKGDKAWGRVPSR